MRVAWAGRLNTNCWKVMPVPLRQGQCRRNASLTILSAEGFAGHAGAVLEKT